MHGMLALSFCLSYNPSVVCFLLLFACSYTVLYTHDVYTLDALFLSVIKYPSYILFLCFWVDCVSVLLSLCCVCWCIGYK